MFRTVPHISFSVRGRNQFVIDVWMPPVFTPGTEPQRDPKDPYFLKKKLLSNMNGPCRT